MAEGRRMPASGCQGAARMSTTHQFGHLTDSTLVMVKVQVPPPRSHLVGRQRLVRRMSGRGSGRLTVVVAPAGWGKTTLLGQWARDVQAGCAVAWVSLDESDDDPVRFWSYVLHALARVAPSVADGALSALGAPGVDPQDVALPMLLNALAATEDRPVLVLDDYHLPPDGRLPRQVEFLVTSAPAPLHVVVSGRSAPPLPLARLRAAGLLSELRAA